MDIKLEEIFAQESFLFLLKQVPKLETSAKAWKQVPKLEINPNESTMKYAPKFLRSDISK